MTMQTNSLGGMLRASAAVAAIAASLAAAAPASAATYTFNFNSLSDAGDAVSNTSSQRSNANAAVQTYMRGVLGAAGSVTTSNAWADKNYTGEGYVVGPNRVSQTLGNTDGGIAHGGSNDTFLVNNGNSDRITMSFSGLSIYSISLDFEIFPNGNCANGNTCGNSNYPDFSVWAGTNSSNDTQRFQAFGVMPGTNGTYQGSPNNSTERAPQLLGTTTVTFATPVTYLEFRDWPTMIGIDNLVINTSPPPETIVLVPEPGSLGLLGGMLAGFGLLRRRRRAA